MSSKTVSFLIAANPPARLDKAIARDVPDGAILSRTRLARLLAEGAVHVNGAAITDAKARVLEGARIEVIVEDPAETELRAEAIPLDIRYEDADLIVVNKPAGMVVHPAPDQDPDRANSLGFA